MRHEPAFFFDYSNGITKLVMAGRSPKGRIPRNTSVATGLPNGAGQTAQTGGQGIGTQDGVRMAPRTAPRASDGLLR